MKYQNSYKVSFCTVCMNRLHHLKQTLLKNLDDNTDYDNLEFILLDYNSTDGLEKFVKTNMQDHLASGRLVYYKTNTPKYFHRSHSRNLAFRLASGDILCNIDADNFTERGFAAYINAAFQNEHDIFLTAIDNKAAQDVLGRVCLHKKDFYDLKGYDEQMISYGFEDHDLAMRLELKNINKRIIPPRYLNAITHQQKERISNERISSELYALYVNYLTPASTEILFLYNDGAFKRGIMVNNDAFNYKEPLTDLKKAQLNYEYSLYDDRCFTGAWSRNGENLLLQRENLSEALAFDINETCFISLTDQTCKFYQLTDPDLTEHIVMFFSQVLNRIIMSENRIKKRIAVNIDFGKDTVYKNLETDPVIV